MIRYLITDPNYYGAEKNHFLKNLRSAIERHNPNFICFRDKISTNFLELAEATITLKKDYAGLIFLNGSIKTAKELGYDGVHLTSKMIKEAEEAHLLGLKTIASTHTHQELSLASQLQISFMTYSPIFATPNKGAPKGVDTLRSVTYTYDNIIALGGVDNKEKIDAVMKAGACGFASIRYFVNRD
ncbi:MAG: thiamine phosphate synthase [Campylobacterales bacterium]